MWGRIDFGHFPNSRSRHSVNRHRNPALCQIQLKFTFPGRVQEIQIQIQNTKHTILFLLVKLFYPIQLGLLKATPPMISCKNELPIE